MPLETSHVMDKLLKYLKNIIEQIHNGSLNVCGFETKAHYVNMTSRT